jgi:hypothetical protein
MACSDGNRHWRFAFSVPVSVTEIWRFPALEFCFFDRRSGVLCNGLGPRGILDLAPFVGAVARQSFDGPVCEPEQIRSAMLGISRATASGDFEKPQSDYFPDCWGDGMAVYAVLDKLVEGHRQRAVARATVARMLHLDAVEDAMRGQAQGSPCRARQHLD